MRKFFSTLGFRYLSFLARAVLRFCRPKIIGFTGTAGKTTACAIAERCLSAAFPGKVGYSPYHYNGEWGLPLTILLAPAPGKNIGSWLLLALRALRFIVWRKYPQYLILEYGIDRPGEMDDLLAIARPDVGVFLGVAPNHLENFSSYDAYIQEKKKLLRGSWICVWNAEDEHIQGESLVGWSYARSGKEADLEAHTIVQEREGLSFSLFFQGEKMGEVRTHFFGSYNTLPIMAAILATTRMGVSFQQAIHVLEGVSPEAGRGRVFVAKGKGFIIDGSYNGGYSALLAGFSALREYGDKHPRILFLGDMRELGEHEKELHTKLIPEICSLTPEMVVLVGEKMKKYVWDTLSKQMPGKVFHFFDSRKAGEYIAEYCWKKEDPYIIFVKGSQNTIFLEEWVGKILAHAGDAKFLCRNSAGWKRKKRKYFQSL